MIAPDRAALLDIFADDVGALSVWIGRRYRRDPDDVRQDLCVLLLVKGERFDPEKVGIRLWLYRTWRSAHARRVRVTPYPIDGLPLESDDPDPADVAELRDIQAAVRAAVDALPIREAGIIRDWFGFDGSARSSPLIAAALGVTDTRVRQIASAGLERLRAAMG